MSLAAPTTADLVEQVRDMLVSPHRPAVNFLSASVDADDTTLVFTDVLGMIKDGALLSLASTGGYETMLVRSDTAPSKTAVVVRGFLGSAAVAHPAGTMVYVNPDVADFAILRALNQELHSLSGAGLFRVKTLDRTTSSTGVRSYNLADDVVDVLSVSVDSSDTGNVHPPVPTWRVLTDLDPAEFASGKALRIDSAVESGRPLRIVYSTSFGVLTLPADDVETTTGLPLEAQDLPVIGAAIRLTAPTEVARNTLTTQGEGRRINQVPPGARTRSVAGLEALRQRRLREERDRLTRLYGGRR